VYNNTGIIVLVLWRHLASFRHHHHLMLLLLLALSIKVLTAPPRYLLGHDRPPKNHQLAFVTFASPIRAVRLVTLERHAHAVVTAASAPRIPASARRRCVRR